MFVAVVRFVVVCGLCLLLISCSDAPPPPSLQDFAQGIQELLATNPVYRTQDGSGNNRLRTEYGQAKTSLLRFPVEFYSDGVGSPSNLARDPSDPRRVSNLVHSAQRSGQPIDIRNEKRASDFLWLWGQFLDHDMDLTGPDFSKERFDIGVPQGDPLFDPGFTGTKTIPFERSMFRLENGIRSQLNEITSFIDGSNIYGSDETRLQALREKFSDGRLSPYLKTSPGSYLPFNTERLMNGPDEPRVDPSELFLAGDVRANENVALASMHTLFVREHNFIVDHIRSFIPNLDHETLFQLARAIVIGELQSITYREFLPVLLGSGSLPPYFGYNEAVNPGIHVFFSTVAFRFGHSMVSPFILRRDANGNPIPQGDLALRDAFFESVPQTLQSTGLEPVFLGLNQQEAQRIDVFVIDDLRNFLFGPPGAGGLDLAALNIQRARDHGLPQYNDARQLLGLLPSQRFSDISTDGEIQTRLASAYASPQAVDAWTGGLAEDHVGDALVGSLFFVSIRDQFIRLRDGDSFWYQRYLPSALQRWVESSTLAEIIRRNTNLFHEIPDDVFLAY